MDCGGKGGTRSTSGATGEKTIDNGWSFGNEAADGSATARTLHADAARVQQMSGRGRSWCAGSSSSSTTRLKRSRGIGEFLAGCPGTSPESNAISSESH